MAHQSSLLLQGLNDPNGNDVLVLLQEISNLKGTIEDERNKYEEEINALQVGILTYNQSFIIANNI